MLKKNLAIISFFIFLFGQSQKLDFEFFLYGLNYNHYTYSGSRLDIKNKPIDIFFDSNKEDLIAEFLIKKISQDSINYAVVKRIDRGPNYVTDRKDSLSQYLLFSEFIKKGLDQNFGNDFLTQQEKNSIFKNVNQINSFITGAYLRDGEKINDTIYKISASGSKKPVYCYSVLKKSNSTNIFYKNTGDFNPVSTTYFNPSKELKEFFSIVKNLPNKEERMKLKFSQIIWKHTVDVKNSKKN